jgi:hypothetical protein
MSVAIGCHEQKKIIMVIFVIIKLKKIESYSYIYKDLITYEKTNLQL